jgi:hypothetical protein
MEIIRAPLLEWDASLPTIRISVERLALAKRRWRGPAEDGCDFGFDLNAPLADNATVFQAMRPDISSRKNTSPCWKWVLHVRFGLQ